MTKLLHELIELSAKKTPESIALHHKNQQLTYKELAQQIKHIAKCYQSLGLTRYGRVGIYLPKSLETVTALFACSAAAGVFVPINPVLKAPQVSHIVADCDIQILVTNKARLSPLIENLASLPSLKHIVLVDGKPSDEGQLAQAQVISWDNFYADKAEQLSVPAQTSNDMAAILYTSGSTGKPKGVVLSHSNMVIGAHSVAEYLENSADDVILAVLPLSFDYGLSQLTTSFSVGATCVLLDYLLPRDVLSAIDKYQVTGLAAVPPLYSQLCSLQWPENSGQSIRYFTNSGGALTQANLTTLREKLPQAKPYLMYGLTEAFRSTYLPPAQVDQKPGSMGKAIPNAEVVVVRPDGSYCEPEEPGELVHMGPLVSLGYWNAPEKTAARFKPAPGKPEGIMLQEMAVWSGDTVKQDKDGFLYFVARADEMIKSSGYRVSPMEVEEILYQYPSISEAAVIGAPHPELGQAIVALILASDTEGTEDQETLTKSVTRHCQKHLANYMIPKQVIVLDSMPHNANGKIDRAALNRDYQGIFTD
ncbi:acyl-CoA ligase (AMP-forming), exosortase A system-associated [Thalassotalea euphylliae]|uniref:Acyl-CoA ligase (AMP-forming), exosortase A system-associated n=1 Tax=Thalassotalea euphylliae TaxID=1655234 RepID=A0A3E0U3C7_9GAMM|nr:acyl-CoA ligase (AMP-forming), exosortase A system-associated [Thalassotalea euphylliae]REL31481.1 acyl-CoA ligase (AMP-forming), exosortase A system-associated [Thalassotalea euphylliae]